MEKKNHIAGNQIICTKALYPEGSRMCEKLQIALRHGIYIVFYKGIVKWQL
jgi:hypothetical protein